MGLTRSPLPLVGAAAVGSALGFVAHVATFKPADSQMQLPTETLMVSEMAEIGPTQQ